MSDVLPAIVGHARPKAYFAAIEKTGRIAHGFLLHGARGRGKHTFARAWLKRQYCRERTGCGRCPPCRRFETGNHPDVNEIGVPDGKALISIAQLRELKEWFAHAPFEAERRSAILDDAQQMTEEAQNSLLKLLEEPPGSGLLILVATDPGALLDTVRSRLQKVHFGPLCDDDVRRVVQAVAPDDAARADEVLPLARGSAGRALALLEAGDAGATLDLAGRLLQRRGAPFTAAAEVCGRAQGAVLRAHVEDVLEAAVALLRAELRDSLAAPAPAAAGRPPHALEKLIGMVVETQRRVRGNAAPRLALEALQIRAARCLALAAKS